MSSQPRLHVVGSSPRSGTTLAFELIAACFDVERLGHHEVSLFTRHLEAHKPYASKRPNDLIHAVRMIDWDRNLHVLYMQRDPRDVVVSQHGSRPGEYWCDFDVWARNHELITQWRAHPRIVECRYEDLVRDPDRVQAELMVRFPFLQRLHAFSEFETVAQTSEAANKALGGVRKVSPSSLGNWHRALPRLAAQIDEHPRFAAMLVDAGYEADTRWLDCLVGVERNRKPSVRQQADPLRGRGPAGRLARRVLRRLSSLRDEARYIAGFSKPDPAHP